jgi:hypothetical protein
LIAAALDGFGGMAGWESELLSEGRDERAALDGEESEKGEGSAREREGGKSLWGYCWSSSTNKLGDRGETRRVELGSHLDFNQRKRRPPTTHSTNSGQLALHS